VSRVLVVDDSMAIRKLLRVRLEMAGHEVLEAHDGELLLGLIEEWTEGPEADLVLIDAMMPKVPGQQALVKVKEAWPELPVLAISSAWEIADDPAWSAAEGFIRKPIDFDELLARIDGLTNERSLP
jgi:DNA-binding response OmpR family regulator